jgi:hypothetical protein
MDTTTAMAGSASRRVNCATRRLVIAGRHDTSNATDGDAHGVHRANDSMRWPRNGAQPPASHERKDENARRVTTATQNTFQQCAHAVRAALRLLVYSTS